MELKEVRSVPSFRYGSLSHETDFDLKKKKCHETNLMFSG